MLGVVRLGGCRFPKVAAGWAGHLSSRRSNRLGLPLRPYRNALWQNWESNLFPEVNIFQSVKPYSYLKPYHVRRDREGFFNKGRRGMAIAGFSDKLKNLQSEIDNRMDNLIDASQAKKGTGSYPASQTHRRRNGRSSPADTGSLPNWEPNIRK